MDLNNLIAELVKKQDVTKNVKVRRLLNLAAVNKRFSDQDLEFIKSLKYKDFLGAYKEIHSERNEILDDMVIYEFAKEDVLSSPDIDEDDIY